MLFASLQYAVDYSRYVLDDTFPGPLLIWLDGCSAAMGVQSLHSPAHRDPGKTIPRVPCGWLTEFIKPDANLWLRRGSNSPDRRTPDVSNCNVNAFDPVASLVDPGSAVSGAFFSLLVPFFWTHLASFSVNHKILSLETKSFTFLRHRSGVWSEGQKMKTT